MSRPAPWTPRDEQLLQRLTDEVVFGRLWTTLAGDRAPRPSRRAAGVLHTLRPLREAGGHDDPTTQDLQPLLAAVRDPDFATLEPRLAHHLALLHDRLADLRLQEEASAEALAHRRVGLASWLWLAEETSYLEGLVERVGGEGASSAERGSTLERLRLRPIIALEAVARRGAEVRSEAARTALRSLAAVESAAGMAGVGEALTAKARRAAERARARVLDEALAPIEAALEELEARDPDPAALTAQLEEGDRLWRWADRDEQVERFLVQRAVGQLWELYKGRRWTDLEGALEPLIGPSERLADRIVGDPQRVAFAAPCAQIFVFRAEVTRSLRDRETLAKRALEVCPTHRNGRVVLAELLVARAQRTLDRAAPWNTGDAMTAAAEDARRAEALFPNLSRLARLKSRMKALGRDLDA